MPPAKISFSTLSNYKILEKFGEGRALVPQAKWKFSMIDKLISHYRILEEIGRGGMGIVYKAEDIKLERLVAIKFLPHHIATNENERKRFKVEAKAAAALNHPNIATIHAIEEVGDEMFIVMEFIEGKELKQLIIDNSQLSIDNCLAIATQIAEGLKAAHAKGIIHRDIKSSNIMVTESGQVKIMDFGLAKMSGSVHITKSRTTLGTAAYMSPEQARGNAVDHRTDIWSFGVVMYEMLTGCLPFRGEYEQAVLYSIVNEDPDPVSKVRTGVPTELEALIHKALTKDVNDRYRQVNQMLVDLKAVQKINESGSLSLPKSRTQSRKKTKPILTQKLPFFIGGIATLALLVIAAAFVFNKKPPSPADKKSIAVLPFVNMSADAENEYFSDGMTEEVINALTKVRGLAVVARTSVFQFKGKAYDIRKFGEQLNVSTVLEGSVRKSGEKLRIAAQLISVADGYHLWSEIFEVQGMSDIFAVQDEIARVIVTKLKVELVDEKESPLVKRSTENLEAYNLYLRGRFFWNDRGRENLNKAIDYFERAIALDSSFAPAYAGLADTYGLLHQSRESSPQTYQKAKRAATKALELDPTLPEAHAALGMIQNMFEWNWLEVEKSFQHAIALNPGDASAHQWYAAVLIQLGRTHEAIAEGKKALELDPLALPKNMMLIQIYRNARQYDLTLEQCQKTLELYPGNVNAQWGMGMAYVEKSMYNEGMASLRQALENSTNRPALLVAGLGYALAVSGEKAEALAALDELQTRSDQKSVSPCFLAWIYAGLGQQEPAIAMLEQAYDERDYRLLYLKVDPMFDNLRSHPRFTQMLKKMGLEK
jgi:serine/threonine-protein kinase